MKRSKHKKNKLEGGHFHQWVEVHKSPHDVSTNKSWFCSACLSTAELIQGGTDPSYITIKVSEANTYETPPQTPQTAAHGRYDVSVTES